MNARMQSRRAVTAATLVVAGLACIALSGEPGTSQAFDQNAADAGLSARTVLRCRDPFAAIAAAEAAAEPAGGAPQAFADEIGLPPGCRDLRVSQDGTVVGYLADAGADTALAELEARMVDRGWTEVPMGTMPGATFLKRGGQLGWAVASCTQVGEATSVVIRCAAL